MARATVPLPTPDGPSMAITFRVRWLSVTDPSVYQLLSSPHDARSTPVSGRSDHGRHRRCTLGTGLRARAFPRGARGPHGRLARTAGRVRDTRLARGGRHHAADAAWRDPGAAVSPRRRRPACRRPD